MQYDAPTVDNEQLPIVEVGIFQQTKSLTHHLKASLPRKYNKKSFPKHKVSLSPNTWPFKCLNAHYQKWPGRQRIMGEVRFQTSATIMAPLIPEQYFTQHVKPGIVSRKLQHSVHIYNSIHFLTAPSFTKCIAVHFQDGACAYWIFNVNVTSDCFQNQIQTSPTAVGDF